MSLTRITTCAVLIFIGAVMSITAFTYGKPVRPLLFGGILPGGPFIFLGLIGLASRLRLQIVVGASLGGLMAASIPYVLFFQPTGGGANIGLGLMLLMMPIYLPLAMIMGAFVSHITIKKGAEEKHCRANLDGSGSRANCGDGDR